MPPARPTPRRLGRRWRSNSSTPRRSPLPREGIRVCAYNAPLLGLSGPRRRWAVGATGGRPAARVATARSPPETNAPALEFRPCAGRDSTYVLCSQTTNTTDCRRLPLGGSRWDFASEIRLTREVERVRARWWPGSHSVSDPFRACSTGRRGAGRAAGSARCRPPCRSRSRDMRRSS